VIARDFASSDDLRSMQRLVQERWATASPTDAHHVGGLAWNHAHIANRDAEMKRRLWMDGERVVAWGWAYLPGELEWSTAPGCEEVLREVLAWFEDVAQGDRLETSVLRDDAIGADLLSSMGYEEDPSAPFFSYMMRDLDTIVPPSLPRGFRLRTATDADVDRRVDLHRAAWEGTRFSAESYREVRDTWPYRETLDCVVEAPDGALASSVIAWLDPENRVGEFEPVDTHPAYRRLGLARAVNLFALERLRDAGATRTLVLCRGDAQYPIPKLLYASAGFAEISRSRVFSRQRR
jgi:ribosomal protein S18 acetylase RimI-like enzyme